MIVVNALPSNAKDSNSLNLFHDEDHLTNHTVWWHDGAMSQCIEEVIEKAFGGYAKIN